MNDGDAFVEVPADARVDFSKSRGVKDAASRALIPNHEADVVAGLGRVPARGEGRGFAHERQRLQIDPIDAVHREPGPIDRNAVPIDAAKMIKQPQHREASHEVLVHQIGGVKRQPIAFAQQQQSRGVIDLPVGQRDRRDAGGAQRTPRL